MFDEARDTGAILLIDEADSFLRSREFASQCWELTETNELLSQIEGFAGVLLIATNLADAIDPATMRRIDVKMAFAPADSARRWALFRNLLFVLGLEIPEGAEADMCHAALNRLGALAPGDYVTIARRIRRKLQDRPKSSHELVEQLESECAAKMRPFGTHQAGFLTRQE